MALGDELNERDLATAGDSVAEYLYLASATAAANWLDATRQEIGPEGAPVEASGETLLRTFGVCRLGSSRELVSAAADQLCLALLERWCGERQGRRAAVAAADGAGCELTGSGALSNAEIERLAQEHIAALGLSVDEAVVGFENAAEQSWGRDADAYLADDVGKILASQPAGDDTAANGQAILAQIGRLVGAAGSGQTSDEDPPAVTAALAAHVKDQTRDKAAAVRCWAVSLANQPDVRLKGAIRAVECIARHVRAMRDTAHAMRSRTGEELRTIVAALARPKPRARVWPGLGAGGHSSVDLKFQLVEYGKIKFLETALSGVATFAQQLSWELSNIAEELKEAQRELAQLAAAFSLDDGRRRPASQPGNEAASAIASALQEMLKRQTPQLVARLDAHLQSELTRSHGGLCAGLAKGAEFCAELGHALRA